MSERHPVMPVTELPPGARRIVTIAGRSIGIFNVDGRLYALRNRCPHQGAELCRGPVVGMLESDRPGDYEYDPQRHLVQCPWHGWEFDLSSGRSYFDPDRLRVKPYAVSVERLGPEEGDAPCATPCDAADEAPPAGRLPGPYLAETYPVSVEDDYVVVQL